MTRKIRKLRSSWTAAITAACLTLASCDDAPLSPARALPEAGAVPPQNAAATSDVGGRSLPPEAVSVAVRDVIERVLPTFEPGSSTTAIGTGLREALASLERSDLTGARQALRAADQSLDVYARQAGNALGPDIDAARLAIAAGL